MQWVLASAGFVSALLAGVFFCFSDFVMRGLNAAPDLAGARGMIGLNLAVYRSGFLAAFLIQGLIAVGLGLWAFGLPRGIPQSLTWGGTVAYFAGVLLVTGLGNVTLNKRLETMAKTPKSLAGYWPFYMTRWTRLNHIRTFACMTAAMAWLLAAYNLDAVVP